MDILLESRSMKNKVVGKIKLIYSEDIILYQGEEDQFILMSTIDRDYRAILSIKNETVFIDSIFAMNLEIKNNEYTFSLDPRWDN